MGLLVALSMTTGWSVSACSCAEWTYQFCASNINLNNSYGDNALLVKATKVSDYHYGMYVVIDDLITGLETADTILVWGDPGFLCRTYVNTLPIGTQLILGLNRLTTSLDWGSGAIEQIGDYELPGCGQYLLDVNNNDEVIGPITPTLTSLPYNDFVSYINQNYNDCPQNYIPGVGLVLNVGLKVLLEGAYDENATLMRNDLRMNNLLPMQQPFYSEPWLFTENVGFNSALSIPVQAVDWVLVELHDPNNPAIVVHQRPAVLLRDGTVQGLNVYSFWSNNVEFITNLDNDSYYVAVKTRNHLAIMSAVPVNVYNDIVIDLTNPANVMGGVTQLKVLNNGQYAMLAGDFNGDGVLSVADYNFYINQVAITNAYNIADCNFDASVTVQDFNSYAPNVSAIGNQFVRY